MNLVKLGIANIDTKVKAFKRNAELAIKTAEQAVNEGYTVVAFPEQTFFGYSPEDLVEWMHLVDAQLQSLKDFIVSPKLKNGTVFVVGATIPFGSNLYNCAIVIQYGFVLGIVPKQELPNYNVFYEQRNFTRGKPGMNEKISGATLGLRSYDIPFGDIIFDFDFGKMAVEVCEDIWSPAGPMGRRTKAGAELVVNLSASPYRIGVLDTRKEMISTRSGDNLATVLYTNLVGANDGLVFDGGGFIANCGKIVHEAPRFEEGLTGVVVDLSASRRKRIENTTWRIDREESKETLSIRVVNVSEDIVGMGMSSCRKDLKYPVPQNQSFFLNSPKRTNLYKEALVEEILDAIALGIKGYFEKSGVFKHIGIALSGGRDSLLALICVRRFIQKKYKLYGAELDAKCREMIHTFYLPTKFSSDGTRAAAEQTAKAFGSTHAVSDIQEEFDLALKKHKEMLPDGSELSRATRQNIQARIRAARMWSWANSAQGMYIQTGNMTEKVTGYLTMGGDSEGALAIISNLPKTVINYMLDYLDKYYYENGQLEARMAVYSTISKPASAELDDNQEDEKDMIPYPHKYEKPKDSFKIIDACLFLMIGEKMSIKETQEVLHQMFPEHDKEYLDFAAKHFAKVFGANIFKWKQSPTSLHLGNLDLDHSRALQLPVVQEKWDE